MIQTPQLLIQSKTFHQMARRTLRGAWPFLSLGVVALVITSFAACAPSGAQAPTAEDSAAIATIATVAVRDAKVNGQTEGASCWAPTEHLIEGGEGEFRVLCRVAYSQKSSPRYKDMICIGNLQTSPVVSSCYEWAYYSDMPAFEDAPAFIAQ